MIQPVIGVLFVSHDLIDRFSDVNATTLQLNLNQGKTIHKDCHIVAIDILADNGCLISDLKDVLCVIIVKERKVHLCSVFTLQNKLVTENLRALKNGFSEHEVKDTLPLLFSQRRIKLCSVKGLKLNFEVCH